MLPARQTFGLPWPEDESVKVILARNTMATIHKNCVLTIDQLDPFDSFEAEQVIINLHSVTKDNQNYQIMIASRNVPNWKFTLTNGRIRFVGKSGLIIVTNNGEAKFCGTAVTLKNPAPILISLRDNIMARELCEATAEKRFNIISLSTGTLTHKTRVNQDVLFSRLNKALIDMAYLNEKQSVDNILCRAIVS